MLFGETMLYEAKVNQNQIIQDAENYRRIARVEKEARRLKKDAHLQNRECCRELKLKRKAEKHIAIAKKLLENHSQTA